MIILEDMEAALAASEYMGELVLPARAGIKDLTVP